MNLAGFTSLEAALLFQALAHHGIDFTRISGLLQNNAQIKAGATYDPSRLSADSLQNLFLQLLSDEYNGEAAESPPTENGNDALSPNSKKRKLQSRLPTLEEVLGEFDRIPLLADKLHNRYVAEQVKLIREDEDRARELLREIQELDKAGRDEQKAKEEEEKRRAAENATPRTNTPPVSRPHIAPAPPPAPSPVQSPMPVSVPAKSAPSPAQQAAPERRNPPTPIAAAQPTPVAPAPSASTPIHANARPQHPQPQQSLHAPGGSGQVLQPPVAVGQQPSRGLQSTSPVPLPAISPRPDATQKPKPAGPQPSQQPSQQPSTPGTLKWEKPYQPPGAVPSPGGRPASPQVPAASTTGTPGQLHPPTQMQPQLQPPPAPQPIQPQPQPSIQAGQGQPAPKQPSQPAPATPQPAGQPAVPDRGTAGRGAPERPISQPPQNRPASTTPVPSPVVPPARPLSAQKQATTQHRPLAAATSAVSPTPPAQAMVPPPRWPQQQQPYQHQAGQGTHQQLSPVPNLNQPGEAQRRVSSPYANQLPRPAIPPHIASQLPASPSPTQRTSSAFAPPPQTPSNTAPSFIRTGSGTKWTINTTPSTPRAPGQGSDFPSPYYEQLSPVQQPAPPPAPAPAQSTKKTSPKPEQPEKTPQAREVKDVKEVKATRSRGRPPRGTPKETSDATPSRTVRPMRRSQSVASGADELSMEDHELASHIKDEEATPRPHDDAGDTTADESVPSRRHRATPGSVSSRPGQKRKRQETPPEPIQPATAPTHVVWTRQLSKISNTAIEQITSHRCANQFANPIRDRDAPGYRSIIVEPQDLKSIRAALTHGNKMASRAAKELPGGDPNSARVLLPIREELVPPKSIINSEQLERELMHIFANAIMYNLDPNRGSGKHFLKRDEIEDQADEPSTYHVDENAVVHDSRIMFAEVESLVADIRSVEKSRDEASGTAGRNASASVAATPNAAGGSSTPGQVGAGQMDDDADELAEEESSTTKRRRTGTRV